jgi:hypothetical protein
VRRWLDPDWYRYLWRKIGPNGKFALVVLAAVVAGVGGFFAVRALGSSDEQTSSYVLMTTLTKPVHVNGKGKPVIERIRVVRRVSTRPVTLDQTTTVLVRRAATATSRVVRYKPVYRRRMVTVQGQRQIVKQVVTDARTATVVQRETTTVVITETAPAETVLVRQAPATVTVTTTAPFITITVPTFTFSMP